ncbi:MAG: phosphotransferase [Caldilineaceae bacterium]
MQNRDHARGQATHWAAFTACSAIWTPPGCMTRWKVFTSRPNIWPIMTRFCKTPKPRWTMPMCSTACALWKRGAWASVLEDAVAAGQLALRAIHGDPKVDNIMLDNTTKQAVSIVDLDTVKPGLVHYDIGDGLRSCCNRLGEETDQIDAVTFDTELCKVILDGYLSQARHFFSQADYDYIYACIRLITFELGLRFFSDHLAGNVYFKVKDERHNLRRALVQFKLCESIEAQEAEIQSIVRAVY